MSGIQNSIKKEERQKQERIGPPNQSRLCAWKEQKVTLATVSEQ